MSDARPLPLADDDTRPYWEAAVRGELAMQRCAACRQFRFPPRPQCPRCHGFEAEWERVSGRGTLASFVVVHGPVLPAFAKRVPFVVALVELAEDPRLRVVGNVVDVDARALRIGMALEVCFERVTDGVVLPQWRAAGANGLRRTG